MNSGAILVRSTVLLVGCAALGASILVVRTALQANVGWRDSSPHQIRSVTVDSSVRLEVLDWGGSGQPIVLLGCYLTAHAYDEFAPKLTDQFRVYGITRRGIGVSDKPATGYTAQRSADDVVEVLDSLKLENPILVGTACAGQVLSTLGAQYPDRPDGLVYLNAVEDPTQTPADYNPPFPASTTLPPRLPEPPPDYSSFEAYRASQQRDGGVAFPEAELRQLFIANADGSMGPSRLSPIVRRAIVEDSRIKPEYARVRAPVLAIFGAPRPFEEVARESPPRNEQERLALSQHYAATNGMISGWKRDLLAGLPTARVVELPRASLYIFLSNEAEVLREIRTFAATLTRQ